MTKTLEQRTRGEGTTATWVARNKPYILRELIKYEQTYRPQTKYDIRRYR